MSKPFNLTLKKHLKGKSFEIAQYLENNVLDSSQMSIVEVAKLLNCVPSTITKTLKLIGFYGWKDWVAFSRLMILTPKPTNSYAKYLKNTLIPSIIETANHIEKYDYHELVNLMIVQKEIIFVGEQFTKDIAQDQGRRYAKCGFSTRVFDAQEGLLPSVKANAIIIFLTTSGRNKNILKSIQYLHKYKKNIVVLFSAKQGASKEKINYLFEGVVHDTLSIPERHLPRHSRIILYSMLDRLFIEWFEKEGHSEILESINMSNKNH